MSLHTCPAGHLTLWEDCPACRYPKPKRRRPKAKKETEVLSDALRIHARIVAERLLAKAGKAVG